MVRKLHTSLTISALFAFASMPALAQGTPPEATIERKAVYLPAGPGQPPWNVTRHTIPLNDIQTGGPPRDGIPALDFPAFVSAEQVNRLLKPDDVVMGIAADGVAKAYPIRILNWHEVVNDEIAGQPVLVSW